MAYGELGGVDGGGGYAPPASGQDRGSVTSQRGNQSAVAARGPTAAGRAPGPRAVEIRNAALALFAERGYAATTMADIGEAVGMRGPSLCKHVGSKQELLTQVMTGTMDDLLRNHRAAVAGCEDVVERLRRAAEARLAGEGPVGRSARREPNPVQSRRR